MITPLPNAWQQKPGSATFPFFGVVPVLLDEKGHEVKGEGEGYLCIKQVRCTFVQLRSGHLMLTQQRPSTAPSYLLRVAVVADKSGLVLALVCELLITCVGVLPQAQPVIFWQCLWQLCPCPCY
jgi:hypothetical protein